MYFFIYKFLDLNLSSGNPVSQPHMINYHGEKNQTVAWIQIKHSAHSLVWI